MTEAMNPGEKAELPGTYLVIALASSMRSLSLQKASNFQTVGLHKKISPIEVDED